MFRYPFLFVLVLVSSFASAQDLIVTNKNDSIKCKIDKDDFEYIYYTLSNTNPPVSSKIKLSDVKNIRYQYQSNTNKVKEQVSTLVYKPSRTFRVFANAGLSYVSAKTLSTDDKVLDNYLDGLKLGYHYNFGLNYYGDKKIGIGLKHTHFGSENLIKDYVYVDTVLGNKVGERSNRIRTNFYAVSFESKTPFFNNKMELLLGLGAAYVHYRNDAVLMGPIKITGGTFGIIYEVGVDYHINKKFAVGLDFNLMQATKRKYTYEINGTKVTQKLDSDKYENISRIDVSAGFRYYINR